MSDNKHESRCDPYAEDNPWPEGVRALAGVWGDLPDAAELRAEMGADLPRETL